MKRNTSQLLLWLYPGKQNASDLSFKRSVSISEIQIVMPKISDSSLRSLLFLMNKKAWLEIITLESEKYLSITKEGISQLEAQFPALKLGSSVISHWTIIIFLEPPKNDKNFRYLRRFLLDKKNIQLTRGVYLSPLALDIQTTQLLEKLYKNYVLVVEADNFLFSDVGRIIGSKINLSDTLNILSGLSRELDEVIDKKNIEKRFTDKQKNTISSIFNRLFNLIEQSYCLESYFFPQVKSTLDLLLKLKEITQL